MNPHTTLWTSPAPLWGRFDSSPGSMAAALAKDQARPAILRFASDDFMDQLLAMLAADPRQIGSLIARPETWRSPSGDAPDLIERVPLPRLARALTRLRKRQAPSTALSPSTHAVVEKENGVERSKPLKLYQPAHQRYYLVGANLVCERVGFPDRTLGATGSEHVGFVLRRLFPPKGKTQGPPFEEYAFVKDASDARWQRIAADAGVTDPAAKLLAGEELLPLFALNFRDDADHPRRLLAGLVPVGRREEYMTTYKQHETLLEGARPGGLAPGETVMTARKEQFKMEVTEPWKNLIRSAYAAAPRIADDGSVSNDQKSDEDFDLPGRKLAAATAANDQAQGQSWLILLDFADFLCLHLRPVWDCVLDPSQRGGLKTDSQRSLFTWLNDTHIDSEWPISGGGRAFASNLRDALKRIREKDEVRQGLEGTTRPFPEDIDPGLAWPDFLCLLAGVSKSFIAGGVHESLAKLAGPQAEKDDVGADFPSSSESLAAIDQQVASLDRLVQLVITAIDADAPATPAPPLPFALRLRDALASTEGDPGWFVLRCVHVRCDCGPLKPAVLSAASERFQLASFFDPDAPARPIRISLPLDTTPAGLRKYSRNTAFVISDVLCGQIQRAKGLGFVDLVLSVLPWPFHKDLNMRKMGPCQRGGTPIGMICSLSLPIITICALILLTVIVSLFDLIFRWLPWFVICFPIPGLKAKKPGGLP
jgi:hypothetical protein